MLNSNVVRMARECPYCSKVIPLRGIDVRRSRLPGAPWFRFVPSQYFCPHCGVRVQPVALPVGRVALAAIVILFGVSFLAIIGIVPLALPVHSKWFVLAVAGTGFALALGYGIWGIKFSKVNGE
jgi:hypothetical protein